MSLLHTARIVISSSPLLEWKRLFWSITNLATVYFRLDTRTLVAGDTVRNNAQHTVDAPHIHRKAQDRCRTSDLYCATYFVHAGAVHANARHRLANKTRYEVKVKITASPMTLLHRATSTTSAPSIIHASLLELIRQLSVLVNERD